MDEDEDKDKMRVIEQGNFLKKRLEKCRGTPQVCCPEGYPLRLRARAPAVPHCRRTTLRIGRIAGNLWPGSGGEGVDMRYPFSTINGQKNQIRTQIWSADGRCA